jgi:hypothetical protein
MKKTEKRKFIWLELRLNRGPTPKAFGAALTAELPARNHRMIIAKKSGKAIPIGDEQLGAPALTSREINLTANAPQSILFDRSFHFVPAGA